MNKITRAVVVMILSGAYSMADLRGAALPATSAISVQGRQLIVDGSTFTVKGVCYSPVKAGYSWSNYDWWGDPSAYNTDFPLIKAMGANCIRTYGVSSNDTYVQNVLDAAAEAGLYVIIGYNVSWTTDFSVAGNRTTTVNDFVTFVNKWKGHRAVLIWNFGNEVDVHTPNAAGWFACLNQAAAAAHAAEGAAYHPVTTANQEVDETSTYDSAVPSLDIWGLNVYRGKTFGNLFTAYTSTKPFIVTEWGCDSFDGRVASENETMQADFIKSQWENIEVHLSYHNSTDSCIGGCVFEWCDEWWKGSSVAGNPATMGGGGVNGYSVQDTVADWTNTAYEDPDMNEEWWGMVRIRLNSYERSPKKAYYTLSELWGGQAEDQADAAAVGTGLFQGEIKNYPNPMINDGYTNTRIRFNVNGAPELKIEIFNLSGEKVREIDSYSSSGSLREAYWNGRDSDANVIPVGLYVCRIKAALSGREEYKYRRIAVVK